MKTSRAGIRRSGRGWDIEEMATLLVMPLPGRVVVGDLLSVASHLARGASEPQSAFRKPIAMARRTTPKVAISTSGIAGSVFIPAIPRAAAGDIGLSFASAPKPHIRLSAVRIFRIR